MALAIIEPTDEIGGGFVLGFGVIRIRGSGCGIWFGGDGQNVVKRVTDGQGLQRNAEEGRGSGSQDIARLELSASREWGVLSAQGKKAFGRLPDIGQWK